MADASDRIHLNVHVTGQVQGVSFRATAHQRAATLGLTGFIRNEPDGSVYAEVEGPRTAAEAFAGWCRRGPAAAVVRSCEWVEGPLKHLNGFVVYHNDGSIVREDQPGQG
ncbi:MAG: acylphosphatase [Candidatus Andersenbacteria bacterium]